MTNDVNGVRLRRVLNFCNGAARTMEEIISVMADATPSQVRESVSVDLDDEEVGSSPRTIAVVRWMSFLFEAAANGYLVREPDLHNPWYDTYGPPRRTK